jgi:hypothetical protein
MIINNHVGVTSVVVHIKAERFAVLRYVNKTQRFQRSDFKVCGSAIDRLTFFMTINNHFPGTSVSY